MASAIFFLCRNLRVRGLLFSCFIFGAVPADFAWSQDAAAYFKANCASCHTIGGGRLTGPDLKGVSERAKEVGKDRDWLITYMQDPQRMINSGDPYAAQLLQEARGVVMPKVPGLDAARAESLLDLIDAESLLDASQFKGSAVSSEPFTTRDVARGWALFTGKQKFKNGATMCMSCHQMSGVGALGGGNLGPDLTRVYEKGQYTTGGRAVLSAWLLAPATPAMQHLLQDKPLEADEVHAIVALMADRAANSQPQSMSASMASFSLLGVFGSLLTLALFDFLWKARFRSVRRTMVDNSKLSK